MEILLTLDSVVQQCSEKQNLKVFSSRLLPEGEVDENENEEADQQFLTSSSPERSFNPLLSKDSIHKSHLRSLSSGCDLRGRFNKQREQLSPKMRR